MKMIRISTWLVALTLSLVAHAESTPGGWILFSWQTNKGWQYALLPNQGRDKHWADLTLVKVHGWDALKSRLMNIPPGSHLAYGGKDEIEDVPSDRLMEVPRTNIRYEIRKLGKARGFNVGSSLPKAKTTISD
jgi:hypothetical protein